MDSADSASGLQFQLSLSVCDLGQDGLQLDGLQLPHLQKANRKNWKVIFIIKGHTCPSLNGQELCKFKSKPKLSLCPSFKPASAPELREEEQDHHSDVLLSVSKFKGTEPGRWEEVPRDFHFPYPVPPRWITDTQNRNDQMAILSLTVMTWQLPEASRVLPFNIGPYQCCRLSFAKPSSKGKKPGKPHISAGALHQDISHCPRPLLRLTTCLWVQRLQVLECVTVSVDNMWHQRKDGYWALETGVFPGLPTHRNCSCRLVLLILDFISVTSWDWDT